MTLECYPCILKGIFGVLYREIVVQRYVESTLGFECLHKTR